MAIDNSSPTHCSVAGSVEVARTAGVFSAVVAFVGRYRKMGGANVRFAPVSRCLDEENRLGVFMAENA